MNPREEYATQVDICLDDDREGYHYSLPGRDSKRLIVCKCDT
jgi:hypothetical protein